MNRFSLYPALAAICMAICLSIPATASIYPTDIRTIEASPSLAALDFAAFIQQDRAKANDTKRTLHQDTKRRPSNEASGFEASQQHSSSITLARYDHATRYRQPG